MTPSSKSNSDKREGEYLFTFKQRKRGVSNRVGIQISKTRISVAQLRVEDGIKPILRAYREIPAKAESLKRIVQELSIQGDECYIVLDHSDYGVITVEAPKVAESEMRDAVKWKIKGLIDIPVEQAVIDVFPIPAGVNVRRGPSQIFVVSAATDTVNAHAKMVKQAGLKLVAVDIAELAIRNIVRRLTAEQNGLMTITYLEDRVLIGLYQGGQLYLSTQIVRSSEQMQDKINTDISRALDYYDRNFGAPSVSRILVWPPKMVTPEQEERALELFGSNLQSFNASELFDIPAGTNISESSTALMAIGGALRGALP